MSPVVIYVDVRHVLQQFGALVDKIHLLDFQFILEVHHLFLVSFSEDDDRLDISRVSISALGTPLN